MITLERLNHFLKQLLRGIRELVLKILLDLLLGTRVLQVRALTLDQSLIEVRKLLVAHAKCDWSRENRLFLLLLLISLPLCVNQFLTLHKTETATLVV